MKPDIKAQWVAALRSGKYNQTEGQLKSSSGYCCLGVLAEELGALVSAPGGGFVCRHKDERLATQTHLACDLQDDIGLTSAECSVLIGMNDAQHLTFPEIAAYIEEHL